MSDLLARKRLNENLIDQLEDAQRRLARVERQAVVSDGDGRVAVAGLLLEVLTFSPAPPPAGHVLVYAQEVAGVTYVRVQDAAGVVTEVVNW